jgi:hypothetical protein
MSFRKFCGRDNSLQISKNKKQNVSILLARLSILVVLRDE